MSKLKIKGVEIVETFAEAFPMVGTRIVITAPTQKWALIAAQTTTGFATSVIACGVEAGIERMVPAEETLDGRPGVAVLMFAMDTDKLQKQLRNRVGQCVLTSPGSACFAGLEGEKKLKLGASLRFFGDGWQMSKVIGGRRYLAHSGHGRRIRLRADDGPHQEGGRWRQSPGARPLASRRALRRASAR